MKKNQNQKQKTMNCKNKKMSNKNKFKNILVNFFYLSIYN